MRWRQSSNALEIQRVENVNLEYSVVGEKNLDCDNCDFQDILISA